MSSLRFWQAGKLGRIAEFLTGRPVTEEPRLYLWGSAVSSDPEESGREFEPLGQVRQRLEPRVTKFHTEPDIMLVVPGKRLLAIEAKFCSGNPLAHASTRREGEKPSDREGLLAYYYNGASAETREMIAVDAIGPPLHSQLFRNIVFASEMAHELGSGTEWHVANLISSTQAKMGVSSEEYSFENAEPHVRCYLRAGCEDRFSSRTWEDLYASVVRDDPELLDLGKYLVGKSAHFERAFLLESE